MARKTTGKKPATGQGATAPDSKDVTKDTPAVDAPQTPERDAEPASEPLAQADGKSTSSSTPEGDAAESGPDDTDATAQAQPDPGPDAGTPAPEEVPDPSVSAQADDKPAEIAPDADLSAPTASLSDPGPFAVDAKDEIDTTTADAEAEKPSEEVAGPSAENFPPDPGASDGTTQTRETGTPVAAPPPPPAAPAKSGFFPMLFGGLLAGGIGYGAHFYLSQQEPAATVDPAAIVALQEEISALHAEIEARAEPPATDLSAIESEIADLRVALAAQPVGDALSRDEIATLIEDEIARAGSVQSDAGEAVDLDPLRGQVDGLSDTLADLQGRIEAVETDLAALRTLAETRVAEAEAAVDTALARSGIEMMSAALELGAPYPEALGLMRDAGLSVPDALEQAAPTGAPTVEDLQARFASAARAALRSALQEAPAESTTERLGNFLRAQVGARSTAPREGDDPDAVLSRAGAAVDAGDLGAALSELDQLPEAAQTELRDWIAQTRLRLDVDAALPEFVATHSNEQGSL